MSSGASFEKYEGPTKLMPATVTIQKSGTFVFSKSLVDALEIGKDPGVFLFWDPKSRSVGFEFTDPWGGRAGEFKVRVSNRGAYFAARGFLSKFGLEGVTFKGPLSSDGGFHTISLGGGDQPLRKTGARKEG